jgi:hypothetical protein
MYCAAAALGSSVMLAVITSGNNRMTAGVMSSPAALGTKRPGKH